MKIIFSLLLVFALTDVSSQDYILNGGFEEFEKCPNGFNTGPFIKLKRKLVNNWFIPTKGSPDYFNRCEGYKGPTFKKWSKSFVPYNGDGVIGLLLGEYQEVGSFNWHYREYAETKINGTLEKDSLYSVEMYVLHLPKSEVVIDSIQLCFSKNKVSEWTENRVKKYNGQVYAGEIKGVRGWQRVVINFKANGNERYLTIGNFKGKNSKMRKIKKIERKSSQDAYYLIDEVRLVNTKEIKNNILKVSEHMDTLFLNQDIPIESFNDSTKLALLGKALKEQQSLNVIFPNGKKGKRIIEKLKLFGVKEEQMILSEDIAPNFLRLHF